MDHDHDHGGMGGMGDGAKMCPMIMTVSIPTVFK